MSVDPHGPPAEWTDDEKAHSYIEAAFINCDDAARFIRDGHVHSEALQKIRRELNRLMRRLATTPENG